MKFKVQLIKSDEGFAISCPLLPGCHSQGKTEPEALENIKEAIELWLQALIDIQGKSYDQEVPMTIREVEIPMADEWVLHA